MQLKPVMESYYVHQQGITALTFHPNEHYIVSASEDKDIKVIDFTRKREETHLVGEIEV